jgi:hypothetical protein
MNGDSSVVRGVAERRLYTWAAVGVCLVVFVGFAKSYYLKGLFGTPELPALRHIHGLVMTLWFGLLLVQARLVSARRVGLHRRLGVFGAALAGLVLVVGTLTAIDAARRGSSPGPPPLVFLAVPLGDMLVFGALAGAGLWFRGRRDIHRRLMLLSSLAILGAAFARIPLDFVRTGGPLLYFGLTDLFVLACVAFDTRANRRLHPAFAWGGLLVLASHPLRLLLAGTAAWMRFATWLAG